MAESSPEETAVLTFLSTSEDAKIDDSFTWSEEKKLDHTKVVGAVKSLSSEGYVTTSDLSASFFELTAEGSSVLENGAQEILVLKTLCQAEGQTMTLEALQGAVGKDVAKIGMGNCMRSKWIQKGKEGLKAAKSLEEVQDEVQADLKALKDGGFATDAIDNAVRRT